MTSINGTKYIILSEQGNTVFLRKLNGKVLNVARRFSNGTIGSVTPLWRTRA